MFMMSRLEWLVLAAALLLLPGFSWGADPEPSLFDRLDKNKDGYLTPTSWPRLEAPATANSTAIAIERHDRDGRISREEFDAELAQPTQQASA